MSATAPSKPLLHRDAAAGRETLGRLRGTLRTMHSHTGADFGWPGRICEEFVMAFDVEWELDGARMSLYRLVMYLSLVAGPLILIDGDFPRPEGMRPIAEWNIERVLSAVPAG